MHARLHDPTGPRGATLSLPAIMLVLLACVVAVVASAHLWAAAAGMTACGIALVHAFAMRRPWFAPRDATIGVGRGFIDVENAGELSNRITAREVIGASAAPIPYGESLVLALRGRPGAPVAMDVAAPDARAVRRALGLGEHGFGAVRWETAPHALDAVKRAFLFVATTLWGLAGVLLIVAALGANPSALASAAIFCALFAVPFTLVAVVLAAIARRRHGPGLELTREALVVTARSGRAEVAYSAIAQATRIEEGIRVDRWDAPPLTIAARRPTRAERGITAAQQDRIASHIEARTNRPPADTPEVRAILARGEAPIALWCARLDDMARAQRGGAGYRAAALDEDALWRALEDPVGAAEHRAAAARVLTRLEDPERRARVEDALAGMREAGAARLARSVLRASAGEPAPHAVEEPPESAEPSLRARR